MMRIIKFRAWIEKDGVMIFDGTLPATFFTWLENWKESKGPFVVMQLTGLKDKNGVEVYEGDLLLCPSGDYHEVIFESYFATFNTKHIKSGEVSDISKDEMEECFEQIVNIYEHKHLIGEG